MIKGKYILKKDLPDLKKGVIFEHREYDSERPDVGNIGCGALVLGWHKGMCQDAWCAEAYILPGQLVNNKEWFKPYKKSIKEELLEEIEVLKLKVSKL